MKANNQLFQNQGVRVLLLGVLMAWTTLWSTQAARLLIPMDQNQRDHLKAYGIAYWAISRGMDDQWLLN